MEARWPCRVHLHGRTAAGGSRTGSARNPLSRRAARRQLATREADTAGLDPSSHRDGCTSGVQSVLRWELRPTMVEQTPRAATSRSSVRGAGSAPVRTTTAAQCSRCPDQCEWRSMPSNARTLHVRGRFGAVRQPTKTGYFTTPRARRPATLRWRGVGRRRPSPHGTRLLDGRLPPAWESLVGRTPMLAKPARPQQKSRFCGFEVPSNPLPGPGDLSQAFGRLSDVS